MSMKSFYWAVLVLFTATSLSFGLAPPPTGQPGVSGKSANRRTGRRHKSPRKIKPGRGALGDPKSELVWLSKGLNLNETQESAIVALLEAFNKHALEVRNKHAQSKDEIDQWKALRGELQEAQKARDQEKIKALQMRTREMAEARRERMAPVRELQKEAQKALFDDITAVLKDEQKGRFETIWQGRFMPQDRKSGSGRNPRVLRDLIFHLKDLQADQRKQIDALFKGYLKSRRGMNKDVSQEEKSQLENKLFSDVLAILTPQQKEIVEKDLDSRHGRRFRRVGRSEMGQPAKPGETDPGGSKTDG